MSAFQKIEMVLINSGVVENGNLIIKIRDLKKVVEMINKLRSDG